MIVIKTNMETGMETKTADRRSNLR